MTGVYVHVFGEIGPHSDGRDMAIAILNDLGQRRYQRYMDENDEAYMDSAMKESAERAWRRMGILIDSRMLGARPVMAVLRD